MNKKREKKSYSKKKVVSTISFFLILLVLALVYYAYSRRVTAAPDSSAYNGVSAVESVTSGDGSLTIRMVDVGQGDAIIIEFPNGETMLIDSGVNQKDGNLTATIDSLGITKFDYLLATHQDADHIGNMKNVFDKYEIEYVFRPFVKSSYGAAAALPSDFNVGSEKTYNNTSSYYRFLQAVLDEGCEWEFFNKDSDFGFEFNDGSGDPILCTFDFLTPTAEIEDIYYANANDYSPIIMLSYAGKRIMLTGDAEEAAENEFLTYYSNFLDSFDVDVLKVGHHGSGSSTSVEFFNVIKPENALISCGLGNSYQHPHSKTMNLFKDNGVWVYRTDQHGNIRLVISKDGNLDFKTDKAIVPDTRYDSPQDSDSVN